MTTSDAKDSNPQYWNDYSNLQRVKHTLIEGYLSGWLPKLGSWSGRILYVDTHAGRGRHKGGEYGSPLIAIRTVLKHKHAGVFNKCELRFFFVEKDEDNVAALRSELAGLGNLPGKLYPEVIHDDCYRVLTELVETVRASNQILAPAFIFVDPYGFRVPGGLLRELMSFERVELFVNVIWRELSMAIAQGAASPGMAETLNTVFDGAAWKGLIGVDFEEQALACMEVLREMIGAKWATHIRMLGANNVTRYMLLHLTNHDAGRDLMKDCMWKISPIDGGVARIADHANQEFLIAPEPDLAPLRRWVLERLEQRPMSWQELIEHIRHEVWRAKHLNQVVCHLREEKLLGFRGAQFSPSQNPELFLIDR